MVLHPSAPTLEGKDVAGIVDPTVDATT
nr:MULTISPECIES: hypothetical protein [Burkholderia cepacia complex]